MNARMEWLRSLPKAELHVHLEGTIHPASYLRIAKRNRIAIRPDVDAAFQCHDFSSFLSAFLAVVKILQQPEDFYELTHEYLTRSADEGVVHVELMVSPATLRYFKIASPLDEVVKAIGAACRQARADTGITSLIMFDMVRNLGEAAALEDIALAERCRDHGVIGVGLGGDESNFPARDFAQAFKRAQELGLRRTLHAGEAAGADSIQDAVRLCGAERIGHGVAAMHNPATMQLLREADVAVDACLTSNDVTGVWNTYHAHPLVRFVNEEVPVTLNSDDPAFFGASLLDEYERAAGLGLFEEQLAQVARHSIVYSFAAQEHKTRWLAQLDAFTAAPRA
ncbi:MAG: adenosine deaminase [Candidatus Eremiobacteraeota bacterium]|nr:adenosine deaminase [Candidatus Eremiobacteraeota bacterium]